MADENQANIGCYLHSQHQQLLSQINTYLAMRKSILDNNAIMQQQQQYIQQQEK